MANKLIMTFDEFITNPSGKGSAVNSTRMSADEMYRAKLSKLTEKKEVEYVCAKSKDGNTYYINFKIPSESAPGFTYDTVVEFTAPEDLKSINSSSLKNYTVKFFSNDPSFIFTYAHTYITHGLLIPSLEKKVNLKAIVGKANTRNPDNAMGYAKSIYFAYLLMNKYRLFDKDIIDSKCSTNITNLFHDIDSFEKKKSKRDAYVQSLKMSKTPSSQEKGGSKVLKSKNFTGLQSLAPRLTKFTPKTKSSSNSKFKSRTSKKVKKI